MSVFRVGEIEAKPGEKASGFLPVEGLDMPDGSGNFWNIPVIIVNGAEKGPVFEVDACIHGEEQLGAYTVLSLANRLNPAELKGTFIGVPILNVPGFRTFTGTRGWMGDGEYVDMNRQFPGHAPSLSATSYATKTFWNEIILKSSYTVNLHGQLRTEGPFVNYNEDVPETLEMAKAIARSPEWIIASKSDFTALGQHGLRWACASQGIPNVGIEYGSGNLDSESLQAASDRVVAGIENCMRKYRMISGKVEVPKNWRRTEYYTHIFVERTGIIYPEPNLKINNIVRKGDLLCRVVDFVGNEIEQIRAPHDGIILCEASRVSIVGSLRNLVLIGTPPVMLD